MKPLRVILAVLALSVPTSAHAALIGLAGGDYNPPPITDPSTFLLDPCISATGLPTGYFCTLYDFANLDGEEGNDAVNSIDFRILDASGNYIPFPDSLFTDNNPVGEFGPSRSDLTGELTESPIFQDGFTFRLSAGNVEQEIDPFWSCYPASSACELVFFVGPDEFHPSVAGFSAAVVGVNGVANPGATAVPEPATLLLLGPAALALLARRRTRREQST